MARRKARSGGKRHSSRRRVGSIGVGKDTVQEVIGAALSGVVTKLIQRNATNMNPKVLSVITLVGGVFSMRQRQPILRGIGYGLVTSGAQSLAMSTGLISGIEDEMNGNNLSEEYINGMGYTMELMSGMPNDDALSGTMSGMRNAQVLSGADDGAYSVNPGMLGW